ncbi:SCP2 sterol-binding domain-containing protein [Micromonospora haikouensis]|uniref:SCP2 sterol-binding domain-containing protein n=1 Tax=Micromonospora haikouensis TaxID=686309 RepID=UPI003421FA75
MTDTERPEALAPATEAGLRSGERAAVRAALADLTRAQLAAWLRTPAGAEVLHDAFRRMPEFFVRNLLGEETVARWRVRRPPAEPIEYDLALGPHGCEVRPVAADRPAAVTLVFDSAAFVEMASGARRGVDLMLHGQLRVQGDVQLAMRMERMFGLDGDGPR